MFTGGKRKLSDEQVLEVRSLYFKDLFSYSMLQKHLKNTYNIEISSTALHKYISLDMSDFTEEERKNRKPFRQANAIRARQRSQIQRQRRTF